jgi:Ca2+-transporting ATPase
MEAKKHYSGLTDAQVVESRKKHGANILTPPPKEAVWKLFLKKFDDPIIKILLIAALLSLGIGFVHNDFIETIGIFVAIILATGVAFWFEYDADKKFDLLNMVNDDSPVKVIRNGIVTEVGKKDIVVGDIVILNTGDEVPADGDLTESVSLQIDESCLTGEPLVEKTTNPEHFHAEATYPSNRLMRGTKVMDGTGFMLVTEVGDATEYGKVARKSAEASGEVTPLNKQLEGLAKFIGVIGFSFAVLTFVSLFIKDMVIGELAFSFDQFYLFIAVLLAAIVLLSKIWVPILFDGIGIITKKEKELPKAIEYHGWLRWTLYSLIVFVFFAGLSFAFGIDPLSSSSWVNIDMAAQILQYFMVAVTLIVVTVPEGLPMSVTLSLALSMRRMLKSNNLVRKMHATETMGATTVICTDKTGTLTKNQMQVYETKFFGLTMQKLDSSEAATLVKENIAVNSTAHLDYTDPQNLKTLGNPTEAALLLWLEKAAVSYMDLRENITLLEQLSFSTERKYMASVIISPTLGKKVLYVKGAPEIVLNQSTNVLFKDGLKSVADSEVEIQDLLLQYQSQAMRTLGFAYEIFEDDKPRIADGKLINHNLTYLGVTAISDPIREDVPDAVQDCLSAGIDVKIVTGDTPGTAKEIGRQIGILGINIPEYAVLTGQEFGELSDEQIIERSKDLKILCRARPSDKQRLVQLLQRAGEVVAVTGDGTNDAPALNYAHVGMSMGSGTSVAKEASDITILDDSFKSIGSAVLWGRSLYQNIQRFIVFQLTINVTAMITVLVGSILGHELPLTVTQMLWVNLIMDTFAAGALASLPPNKSVMKRKPRKNSDFIITRKMRSNILFMGLSFVAILFALMYFFRDAKGDISEYNLSVFFAVFVMMQFWNMFNVKAFMSGRSAFYKLGESKAFLLVLLLILAGQVLITQFGGEVFRTVPLSFNDWLMIIGSTSLILWIGELRRLFFK